MQIVYILFGWSDGLLLHGDHWRKRIALLSQPLHLVTQIVKKKDKVSVREAAFSLSLSSFQNLIYHLDGTSILSGLGYDYWIDLEVALSSAALHYNGYMKPWLELGIPDYKKYCRRFLTQEVRFMDEYNVNL